MPSKPTVLDASALLALLQGEPGAKLVEKHLRGALLSAVNLSEVLAKASERGFTIEETTGHIQRLPIVVEPFDTPLARAAAALRVPTRSLGLSLGDRACLALGLQVGGLVLTAEKKWDQLDLGVAVRVIR